MTKLMKYRPARQTKEQRRLTKEREREFGFLCELKNDLKAAEPIDGIITLYSQRMTIPERDYLIARCEQDQLANVKAELRDNPQLYVQWPDGSWGLREHWEDPVLREHWKDPPTSSVN
jgi:hypothetical protein